MEANLQQEDQEKYFEKVYFRLRITSVFLLIVLIMELYPLLGLISAFSLGREGGWGILIATSVIFLSFPIILIILVFQTSSFLKIRKSPKSKKIIFPKIMMLLGYTMVIFIIGLWFSMRFFGF